jgi:hypothetical protein
MKKLIAIVLLALCFVSTKATHIINTNMYYTYIGNNGAGDELYKVSLVLFRDCDVSPVGFDAKVSIGIYANDSAKNLFQTESVSLAYDSAALPIIYPSGSSNNTGCYKKGVYTFTFTAPKNHTGFYLIYQRCCRRPNNNVMDDEGTSVSVFIPVYGTTNSAPQSQSKEVSFILGTNVFSQLDFSHQDIDGDSISYKLFTPFAGGSTMNPFVDSFPPKMPVISGVKYRNGFSGQQPFKADNPLNLDAYTGKTLFNNRLAGLYLVGVQVDEWRNGVLLATHYREYSLLYLGTGKGNGIDLNVTADTTNVHLICTWTKTTTDTVLKYKLLRRADTLTTWDTIATLQPQDTSYTDTSISKDVLYWYFVKAETQSPILYSQIKSGYIGRPTSVKEKIENVFSVYPNPATNNIYIKINSGFLVEKVLIITLEGKIIAEYIQPTDAIDISELSQGTYTVLVQGENRIARQLFIKQ